MAPAPPPNMFLECLEPFTPCLKAMTATPFGGLLIGILIGIALRLRHAALEMTVMLAFFA